MTFEKLKEAHFSFQPLLGAQIPMTVSLSDVNQRASTSIYLCTFHHCVAMVPTDDPDPGVKRLVFTGVDPLFVAEMSDNRSETWDFFLCGNVFSSVLLDPGWDASAGDCASASRLFTVCSSAPTAADSSKQRAQL